MRFAGTPEAMALVGDSPYVGLVEFVAREYERGNHLVDGGPEVGLFWATNISAIGTHQPRPLQQGLELLAKYGGPSQHRHLTDRSKHSF